MPRDLNLLRNNFEAVRRMWGDLSRTSLDTLEDLTKKHSVMVSSGEVILLDGKWYVTHSGLLGIARRNHCRGIHVQHVINLSNTATSRWTFKATVYKSRTCKGFVGYGDADPSNVSPPVRGAEMRVAETRAVNRALRKAYGIGICSVEEIGSVQQAADFRRDQNKIPAQPASGSPGRLQPRLRDRLCQLIRQHQLDPVLVKSYALEFCGTKTLNEANREQIETFITHLSDCAAKDKHALLCQLNSYVQLRGGAA